MIFSSLCADRSKYTLRLFFMLRVYRKITLIPPYRIVYQRENAFPIKYIENSLFFNKLGLLTT